MTENGHPATLGEVKKPAAAAAYLNNSLREAEQARDLLHR